MSECRIFVPSGRYLIGMVSERVLTFFSFHIAQIKFISSIFFEGHLNLHQCSLGWEVYLGNKLKYLKTRVLLDQI